MSVQLANLGRYRLDDVLGYGGMAVVYRGYDCELERAVAVKLLADNLARDDGFRERFLREARLAARLTHPNIVQVYDVGEVDGRPFIVMEFLDGETLADRLARDGRMDPNETVEIALHACAGLEHAHEHGLVHRDIKPQNLLLRRDGTVKIADFGIARSAHGTKLTEVGSVLGTAAYLAPEQAAGEEVTPAADIYALGVVLYEMLTGHTPYTYETLTQPLLVRYDQVVPAICETFADVPPALEEIVMRCLARLPEYRPASAAKLGEGLSGTRPELPTRPLVATSEAPTQLQLARRGSTTGATRVAPVPDAAAGTQLRFRSHLIQVSRGKLMVAAIIALVAIALIVAAAMNGGSPGQGARAPTNKPALQQARDLSNWLRAHSQH